MHKLIVYSVILLMALYATVASASGSLDLILSKHAAALGGVENLEKIKSSYVEIKINMGGMEGRAESYFKAPDKFRVDLTLPIIAYTQACDGGDCWMSDNQGLVHSLAAEFKGLLKSQAAIERWEYLDPENFNGTVELTDTNYLLDDKPCYLLTVTPDSGVSTLLFISRESYLLNQLSVKSDLGTIITTFDDYRQVEGVMIAFQSTEQTEVGFVSARNVISKIELNLDLADSLFKRVTPVDTATFDIVADSILVPIEVWRNHVYVKVRLGDQGPYDFIFDTGAGGIGLNSRLIEQLSLEKLGSTEARGVGGADQADAYRLERIQIGECELADLVAYSIDLRAIEDAGGKRIDGVIGYELLSRFVVSLNYSEQRMILYQRTVQPRAGWGEKCQLIIDFRLPYIDLVLNDSIGGRFRLDTGSSSTLDINSPFVESNALIDPELSQHHEVVSFGLGGTSTGLVGILHTLKICNNRIDSLFVNYSTSTTGIFAGAHSAGNIGSGILKGFEITFDYGRESVFFKKSHDFSLLGRKRNMADILLKYSNDVIMVNEVFAGGAADGILEKGDIILSVDGKKVDGMSINQINWIFIDLAGGSAEIEVKRGSEKALKRVTLSSLY